MRFKSGGFVLVGLIFVFVFSAAALAGGNLSLNSKWQFGPRQASTDTWFEYSWDGYRLEIGGQVTGILEQPEARREYLDRLALTYSRDGRGATGLEFAVGRMRPAWEFAGFQSVMLFGKAPGYPTAKVAFNWDRIAYERFAGRLGPDDTLVGHRFGLSPVRGVEIGFKEVARYKQDFPGMWIAYLPFYPLYLTKYIPGTDGVHDNMELGFDLRVDRFSGFKLYADFYATEWPMVPDSPQLPLYGLQLGLRADLPAGCILSAEYVRMTNFLYTHRNDLDYIYKGVPLGHPLGPDADSLRVRLQKPITERFQIEAGFRRERKGEGRVGDTWTNLPEEERKEKHFLSGVVETRYVPQLGLSWQISEALNLSGYAELQKYENYAHQSGVEKWRLGSGLSIRWEFF